MSLVTEELYLRMLDVDCVTTITVITTEVIVIILVICIAVQVDLYCSVHMIYRILVCLLMVCGDINTLKQVTRRLNNRTSNNVYPYHT